MYYESYYGIALLDDSLTHHGVKGQKWYHRLYQNKDGSLTALGRIHYGVGKGKKNDNGEKEQQESNHKTGKLTDDEIEKALIDKAEVKDTSGLMSGADAEKLGYRKQLYTPSEERASRNIDLNDLPETKEKLDWKKSVDERRAAIKEVSKIEDEYSNDRETVKKYATKSAEEDWPYGKELGWKDEDYDDWVNMYVYEDFDQGRHTGFDIWLEDTGKVDKYRKLTEQSAEADKKEREARETYVSTVLGNNASRTIKTPAKMWKFENGKFSTVDSYEDTSLRQLLSESLKDKAFAYAYGYEKILHSDDSYLMHHGVKGMKWYRRRYQNEDGSLTALGRIHYGFGKGRKEEGAKDLVDAYDAKKKEDKAAKKAANEESAKQKLMTSGTAAQILKNSDKLTNQELQQAINRINMKQQLSKMVEPKQSIVEFVNDKFDKYGKLANTIATFKNNIDNVAKAFEDPDEAAAKKLQNEIATEEAKSRAKALSNVVNNDLANKLKNTINDARKNAKDSGASDAEVERAAKLATDKFLSNVESSKTGKKNETYDSFSSMLTNRKEKKEAREEAARLAEQGKKLKALKEASDNAVKLKAKEEAAQKRTAAKEEAKQAVTDKKASQEAFLKKLSDVANQFDQDRNGARDSQRAYDRFNSLANDVRIDRINRESTPAIKSFMSSISSYKPQTNQPSLSEARDANARLNAMNAEKRQQAASESFDHTYKNMSSLMDSGKSAAKSVISAVSSTRKVSDVSSSASVKAGKLTASNKELLDKTVSYIKELDKK